MRLYVMDMQFACCLSCLLACAGETPRTGTQQGGGGEGVSA